MTSVGPVVPCNAGDRDALAGLLGYDLEFVGLLVATDIETAATLDECRAGDVYVSALDVYELACNIFVTFLLDGCALRGGLSEFVAVVVAVKVAESNSC